MISSNFKIKLSKYWIQVWLVMVLINIVINHLTQPEHFPLHESYQFPLLPISVSILIGSVFMIIIDVNFQYFKRKYFLEKVDTGSLSKFLLSSLGYISLIYIVLYYAVNGLGIYNVYYLLSGLLITLLLTGLGLTLGYAKNIYQLYRSASIEGKLKILNGGKITLINYEDIAFAYSQNKIAYIIKSDGTSVATSLTLNEIEEKVHVLPFYRANHQTIIHPSSVEQVQSIENGKLSVSLQPALVNKDVSQLTISRYKKQEFLNWLDNKS